MSYYTLSLVCAAACIALAAGQNKLPASIKTCKRDSPDHSSCLRLAIQESWPAFIEGIPELGVPPMDPYYTEHHENNYENGEMRGMMSASDVRTYGLAKARFLSVKPEFSDDYFRLEIDVDMPKLLIDGNYKANGSMGAFKIGGKGFFNISMEDVRTLWDIQGRVENDRWIIEHFKVAPQVGSMRVWFSDLFNGNEELNRAALSFVNEYWPIIYRGMLPYMVDMWDKYFTEFMNDIFSKLSFSEVFP